MEAHPIDRAAEILGSEVVLAAVLGVTRGAVNQWKAEGRRVPIRHCLAIEKATRGRVTRQELRPDDWQAIWPDLSRKRKAKAVA